MKNNSSLPQALSVNPFVCPREIMPPLILLSGLSVRHWCPFVFASAITSDTCLIDERINSSNCPAQLIQRRSDKVQMAPRSRMCHLPPLTNVCHVTTRTLQYCGLCHFLVQLFTPECNGSGTDAVDCSLFGSWQYSWTFSWIRRERRNRKKEILICGTFLRMNKLFQVWTSETQAQFDLI